MARNKPWRQLDLGRLIGVSQGDVGAYEGGKVVPSLPKALDIANALGKPVETVFFELNESSIERVGQRRRELSAPRR